MIDEIISIDVSPLHLFPTKEIFRFHAAAGVGCRVISIEPDKRRVAIVRFDELFSNRVLRTRLQLQR